MPVDYLAEGIAAVKAGQKQEARRLLAAAIRLAPNDARAWGWFFPVCANDAERIRCLKEVLRIQPDQPAVRKRYDELVARQPAAVPTPPPAPQPVATISPKPPAPRPAPTPPQAARPAPSFPPLLPGPSIHPLLPAPQTVPTPPPAPPQFEKQKWGGETRPTAVQPVPTPPPAPPQFEKQNWGGETRPTVAQPTPAIPPIPPRPQPVPTPPHWGGEAPPLAPKPAAAKPSPARKPAEEKSRLAFAVTMIVLLCALGVTALVLAGFQLKAVPAASSLLPQGNAPAAATQPPLPTSSPIPTQTPLPTGTPIPTETLPPPSATPSPSATPDRNFVSPGLHVVGRDIQPGLYRGQAGADIFSSCYWERLKDFSNTQESILTNDNAIGQFYIQVDAKDAALQTVCSLEYLPSLPQPANPFPQIIQPGTYLVGIDIQPGQYQGQAGSDNTSTCYWERLNALSRSPMAVINNGLPTGTFIVKVESYDKAFLTECTLKRVGD